MGRKKRGNVLFARRVHPSRVPELLALIKEDSLKRPESVPGMDAMDSSTPKPPSKDPGISALLDDNERLERELKAAREAIPQSDSELVNLWKARAEKAERRVRELEQERF